MYDITNLASFENVEDWYNCAKKVFGKDTKMPHLALVGNKSKCIIRWYFWEPKQAVIDQSDLTK